MIDLSTLVSPLSKDEFLSEHWPDKPYRANSGSSRLDSLSNVPDPDAPKR